MEEAVRSSSPIAGVPSSRLGDYMWVSWWTKLNPGRVFSEFIPFSHVINCIPYFATPLIHFISLAPVMVRQAWSAGILAIHRLLI